jgi:hypothetical protein
MVKKDSERAGTAYETPEADFYAGRDTYITGLLTKGAALAEAKELVRHMVLLASDSSNSSNDTERRRASTRWHRRVDRQFPSTMSDLRSEPFHHQEMQEPY